MIRTDVIRLAAPLGAALGVGCAGPLDDVAAREAVWWGAPEGIEEAVGIDLVDLPGGPGGGEPLGYWPRVVVRQEGLDFDTRAWALSLPDELLLELTDEERDALVLEATDVAKLTEGRLAEADAKSPLIMPLFDVFEAQREALRAFTEAHELDYPQTLVVVPDAGVPMETLRAVLYTAGQGLYMSEYTVAGAHEGRLRGAMASSDSREACAILLVPELGSEGLVVSRADLPPVAGAGGQCPVQDGTALLLDYQARCAPLWAEAGQAAWARIQEETGAAEALPAAEEWQCLELWLSAGSDVSAEHVLGALSGTLAAAPALRLGPLVGSPTSEARCEEAVTMEALTADQLALVCDVASVQADWEQRLRPVVYEENMGLGGLMGMRGYRRPGPAFAGIEPLSDDIVAAFPAWAQAEDDRRAEARAGVERRRAEYLEERLERTEAAAAVQGDGQ